ncbi:hypothetical protein [Thioalkalivibrio sp.]
MASTRDPVIRRPWEDLAWSRTTHGLFRFEGEIQELIAVKGPGNPDPGSR